MKIKPIVLAAGFGKRFGENKLLFKIDGKPLFMYIVNNLFALSNEGILETPIVVTQYDEIKYILSDTGIPCVFNKTPSLGISSSIKTGIENAGECDAYMFFTADQPYLTLNTIRDFVLSFVKSNKELGCVVSNKKTGNPCIFKSNFKNALMNLEGSCGGKAIIKKHMENVLIFPVSGAELKDIDYLDDLELI